MKMTQFGRMKRRIKKELEAARATHVIAITQAAGLFASGAASIELIRSAIVTKKMLDAWKKENAEKITE